MNKTDETCESCRRPCEGGERYVTLSDGRTVPMCVEQVPCMARAIALQFGVRYYS